jgi:hypothetical protein
MVAAYCRQDTEAWDALVESADLELVAVELCQVVVNQCRPPSCDPRHLEAIAKAAEHKLQQASWPTP